jgi:phage shock protein C
MELQRSSNNRFIAGVCGGIAQSYGWDPTLVRLVYVLLTLLLVGTGILVYLVLWIIMPLDT